MGMLADRIKKNARHLGKWARRQGFACLRLYNHDIPEYAFSLDDYQGNLLLTLSEGCAQRHSREHLEEEIGLCLAEPKQLVFKQRGQQYDPLDASKSFLVREGDLSFEVNLHGYQDTGLFLDHRLTRQWFRQLSQGARVLNLFCYTGSFSVAAAAGGAEQVTSIDLSNTYLEWARRNFVHNRLELEKHRFLQGDVMTWVTSTESDYDLILCDPPTFSNSKRMQGVFDVQTSHPQLLRKLQSLLRPQGQILFSCNDRRFRLDNSLDWPEITAQTRSPDFARRGGHRCWHWRNP